MNFSDNAVRKLFMAFGLVFLAIGAVGIIISLYMNVRMENSRQVSATVVEVIEETERDADFNPRNHRRRSHTSVMYTSVYEYSDGGEVRRYTSNVSTSKRAEIGSEATLYISEDGKVYERSGAAIVFLVGIIFAVVGGVFAFITFKLCKKKTEETEERYL